MTTPGQLTCSSRGRLAGVLGGIRSVLLVGSVAWLGCASAPPTEDEIQYARSMSPSVELATTPTEVGALERAASLPVGEPAQLEGGVVVAGPIYAAASGRRCRQLTFGSAQRLACEDPEADVWVFVPDVFAASPVEATEPAPTSGGEADPEGSS